MTQMSERALALVDSKAMVRPSGDHAGSV